MIINSVQIRKQLNAIGIRQQAEDFISSVSQDDRDEWNYSPSFSIQDNLIGRLGIAIGLTETKLAQFFEDASKF